MTQGKKNEADKKATLIAKLKETHNDVFEVVLEGEEFFDEYHSFFRKPTQSELDIFLTTAMNEDESFDAQVMLLRTIFIGGHDDFFEDALSVVDVLSQLEVLIAGLPIEVEKVAVKNKLGYKIIILDEEVKEKPTCVIGRPNPDQMTKYQKLMKGSILSATKKLYKDCWIDGDKTILDNDVYFISLSQALSNIMQRRKAHLEKH